jgi:hypothetical protein
VSVALVAVALGSAAVGRDLVAGWITP